jgi:hypothetical protein
VVESLEKQESHAARANRMIAEAKRIIAQAKDRDLHLRLLLGAAILRIAFYSYQYGDITLTLGGCSNMNQSHMRLV